MTEKQLTPDGSTHITIVASIPEILREYGVNPAEVLRLAGIPADVFDDPDNLICFKDRAHLLKLCVDHTGCSHFGLLVGEHSGLPTFGLIGYLMKSRRTHFSATIFTKVLPSKLPKIGRIGS